MPNPNLNLPIDTVPSKSRRDQVKNKGQQDEEEERG